MLKTVTDKLSTKQLLAINNFYLPAMIATQFIVSRSNIFTKIIKICLVLKYAYEDTFSLMDFLPKCSMGSNLLLIDSYESFSFSIVVSKMYLFI